MYSLNFHYVSESFYNATTLFIFIQLFIEVLAIIAFYLILFKPSKKHWKIADYSIIVTIIIASIISSGFIYHQIFFYQKMFDTDIYDMEKFDELIVGMVFFTILYCVPIISMVFFFGQTCLFCVPISFFIYFLKKFYNKLSEYESINMQEIEFSQKVNKQTFGEETLLMI